MTSKLANIRRVRKQQGTPWVEYQLKDKMSFVKAPEFYQNVHLNHHFKTTIVPDVGWINWIKDLLSPKHFRPFSGL